MTSIDRRAADLTIRDIPGRTPPHEHSVGQCQAFVFPSAARTGLAAGKETPSLSDGDACILGHVGENTPKLCVCHLHVQPGDLHLRL